LSFNFIFLLCLLFFLWLLFW